MKGEDTDVERSEQSVGRRQAEPCSEKTESVQGTQRQAVQLFFHDKAVMQEECAIISIINYL